jgi:hypothetical protein
MSRNAIYTALFNLLTGIEGLKVVSRKLVHWADAPEFPALYLHQKTEHVSKSGRGQPSKSMMHAEIYVYVKVDSGADPSPFINDLVDKVETALVPVARGNMNQNTLGGLVTDCWIDGDIMTDEGVLGELGVAIIPITIITA